MYFLHPQAQSDNPDLRALPEDYGAYILTAYDDSACKMIPHLSLTGLHPKNAGSGIWPYIVTTTKESV